MISGRRQRLCSTANFCRVDTGEPQFLVSYPDVQAKIDVGRHGVAVVDFRDLCAAGVEAVVGIGGGRASDEDKHGGQGTAM